MKLYLKIILLVLCISCFFFRKINSNEVNQQQILLQNIDSIRGAVTKSIAELPEFVMRHHDSILSQWKDSCLNVIEESNYVTALGWSVFLIKGEALRSDGDFVEYDFYGLYKNNKVYCYDIYAFPVEIVTEFETFIVTANSAEIYGRQWDLAGLNDGKKPPKKNILLINFPHKYINYQSNTLRKQGYQEENLLKYIQSTATERIYVVDELPIYDRRLKVQPLKKLQKG